MFICPNCQNTSDTPTNFCSKCGTPMVEKAPEVVSAPMPEAPAPAFTEAPKMPEPPVYTAPQPMPEAPVYTAPQPISIAYEPEKKVPLGKVIAGMAIAIAGFVFAVLTVLYSLIFLAVEPEVAIVFAVWVGGFFAFPLSMVGFVLSKGSVNAGCKSPMAKVGKILGLVGFICAAASFALTVVASAFNF